MNSAPPTGPPLSPPGAQAPAGGPPPLRRLRRGRILGGVCAGLARNLRMDPALVRILAVLGTVLTSGALLLVYVAAWIFIPVGHEDPGQDGDVSTPAVSSRDPLFWVGVVLLLLGAIWLLGAVGSDSPGWLRQLAAPSVLIAFGLALWRAGERKAETEPATGTATSSSYSAGFARNTEESVVTTQFQTSAEDPVLHPETESAQPDTPSVQPAQPGQQDGLSDQPLQQPAQGTQVSEPTARLSRPPAASGSESTPTRPLPTQPPPAQPTQSWQPPPTPREARQQRAQQAAQHAAQQQTQPVARQPVPPHPNPPGPPPPGSPPPGTGGGGGANWTPPPAPRRERSYLGRWTFGLSMITIGVLWILNVADVTTLGWGAVLSAGLLVIGVGLLVGAWFGRARWLIVIGLLLAPFVLIAQFTANWFNADWAWADRGGVGVVTQAPLSVDELEPSYEFGAGQLVLDLSDLELDGGSAHTAVDVGTGLIEVTVPDDVEVHVDASVGVGELNILGRSHAFLGRDVIDTHVPDNPNGTLELDLSMGMGEIVVELVPADESGGVQDDDLQDTTDDAQDTIDDMQDDDVQDTTDDVSGDNNISDDDVQDDNAVPETNGTDDTNDTTENDELAAAAAVEVR